MRKRDFNFKSIVLVYLISFLASFLILSIFKSDSGWGTLIAGLVTALFEFAVSRGLIVNRMGDFGEYLEEVKSVNLNFFLVNLLFVVLEFLITLISAGSIAGAGMGMMRSNFAASLSAGFGMIILTLILTVVLSLVRAYANFVVADPRNEDLTVVDAFKKVFSTGFALLGKTFVSLLKYTLLPLVVFIIVMAIIAKASSGGPGLATGLLLAIVGLVFLVAIVYLIVKYKAEISDHYLNLYGDYDGDYTYDDDHEEPFKLTREVESNPEDDEYDYDPKNNVFDNSGDDEFDDKDDSSL